MKKLILASGLLLLLTVTACQNKHKQGSGNLEHKTLTDSSIVKIIPEYAQGFKITYTDQACLLDIQDPQNKESQSFHYALVPRGCLLYTSPSPRDAHESRMPSSA